MSIFIIAEDSDGEPIFDPESDEFGYFTDGGLAQAAIDARVQARRIDSYERNMASIIERNAKIDVANREKAAIEAAGLEYKYRFSFGTERPGPLAVVPTLDEWLARPYDRDYVVVEVKPNGGAR